MTVYSINITSYSIIQITYSSKKCLNQTIKNPLKTQALSFPVPRHIYYRIITRWCKSSKKC